MYALELAEAECLQINDISCGNAAPCSCKAVQARLFAIIFGLFFLPPRIASLQNWVPRASHDSTSVHSSKSNPPPWPKASSSASSTGHSGFSGPSGREALPV